MNHELNNSLAPIRSLMHSGRTALSKPEHHHLLGSIFETVEERVRHLSQFLENYSRFARLPKPQKTWVSWAEFLDNVRTFSPFTLSGELPLGNGYFDPGQLQQALINLLKNAHEAGGDPAAVQISLELCADGAVAIRVWDRGTGIPEDTMKNALLPFFTSKPQGTGLGLPLCNEIIEAHGGRLTLQNREGGGTVVSCQLPAREVSY